MKKTFYSVLFILTISIFACHKKKNDPAPVVTVPNSHFSFLKDNYQWNYNYDFIFSSGTMVMKEDSIGNNLYRIFTSYDSAAPDTSYWFVSGPYLKVYQAGETAAQGKIIYKSNPALNDNWSSQNSSGTINYKVVNLDTAVTTTAGTFTHCRRVEVTFSYAFNTQYNYWSDSYGLVYQTGFASLDLTSKNFRQGVGNKEYGYTRW